MSTAHLRLAVVEESPAVRGTIGTDALVYDVRARVPQPVESLEIAAVLESMGVTDAVAYEDYGAENTFELAERIFGDVRARDEHDAAIASVHRRTRRRLNLVTPGRIDTSARNLVSLTPLAMLIAATQALAGAGWSGGSILAVSLGVTTAMLLTMGPMAAISRRTSILISFGYRASAHRFLTMSSFATLLGCLIIGGLAAEAVSRRWQLGDGELSIFALSLAGFALFWLLAMGLVTLGEPAPVALSLIAGLGLGIVAGVQLGGEAGVAIGYGATVVLLVGAWAYAAPREIERRVRLPAGVGIVEAIPYVCVGTAVAVLIAVPHPLGWFGGGTETTFDRLLTFELSLLLALLPLLLAAGFGDRILRTFWTFAEALREENSVDGFRRCVTGYVLRGLASYILVLGALSFLTVLAVELAMREGRLDDVSRLVFWCGLGGFLLLGVGQYCSTFMLGLSLPRQALGPLLVGLAVLAVLGIPLSERDFELAAVAFVGAAGAFAVAATIACIDVLIEVPRRYSTAF
jgi:hypothetical protein